LFSLLKLHRKPRLGIYCLLLGYALPLTGWALRPPPQNPSAIGESSPAQASSEQRDDQETEALNRAFDSAAGNPQTLIKNLEDFLARYPQSPRREQVLRTILKQATLSNDPGKAASTAEKLLEQDPEDINLLSTLVNLADRQNDSAIRQKGIQYATRLIDRLQRLSQSEKPSEVSAEKWQETESLMRASGFALRGKIYAKEGETDKAIRDYQSSFEIYPTAEAAERLGDLEAKKGRTDSAIDAYATAFAIPDKSADPARRDQVRQKLGSAYLAKYHTEKGLGDLILSKYDELVRKLHPRFQPSESVNFNARDPFDYVLRRLDGSELRLAAYRGKVVVMDFWATWCGPCRLEGRLLEKLLEDFRQEPRVQFLGVNVEGDKAGVAEFVKDEKWTIPVAYAQGLDHMLMVRSIPTVIIFDTAGRVVYRQEGIDPPSFIATMDRKIRDALQQVPPTPARSR
jgi:thiol-disulfide isomerase/thioredoxin